MTVVSALCVKIPHRDEFFLRENDGTEIPIAVCPLAKNATLSQIFEGFGFPLEQVGLTPEQCQAFRDGYNGFLDEDHATIVLRKNGEGSYDVVRYELDDRCALDEMSFPLKHDFVWKAADVHQVVIPGPVRLRFATAA